MNGVTANPKGFRTFVTNAGVKDRSDDFVVVVSESRCTAAGVFTKSRFAGPAVKLSRAAVANGRARAVAVVSKNANVANGEPGERDARTLAEGVARAVGVDPDDVLQASTGVIGRRYPMDRISAVFERIPQGLQEADFDAAARGIMTTDTRPKTSRREVGEASIVGIAKGVGMIEPNMATLLAFFFTDAAVPVHTLQATFRRVVDRTFNCLSIDTDTSTSDTALVLANGVAGPVDPGEFEWALNQVALDLVKQVARDGEGATKLIEVAVGGARDDAQAKRVAKSIVNSPLVKTAVHGADPNWGRIAMAVGKCDADTDIDPEHTTIYIAEREVFPRVLDDRDLAELSELLRGDEVALRVDLGIGVGDATVWGCDLSDGYVRINADYTS